MSGPDFYSMHARKILGLPDAWRWISLNAEDDGRGNFYTVMVGAIPDGVCFKSGKRKGEINWKFRHEERRLLLGHKEHAEFIRAWEVETGKCSKCGGSGQTMVRWTATDGAIDGPCSACAATGKPRATPEHTKEGA